MEEEKKKGNGGVVMEKYIGYDIKNTFKQNFQD